MKYAARIAYLGKNYCGWQRQISAVAKETASTGLLPSIQETVEEVIHRMLRTRTQVIASGRTDAGVHAVGQVIHFRCHNPKMTAEIFRRGMNTYLPPDIRVISVKRVPDDFHAQRSATHKQYSYYYQQGPCPLPHLMDTSWWIYRTLDIEAMNQALDAIRGEHDFKAFQGRKATPTQSTVRSILEAEITREPLCAWPGRDLNEIGFSMVRLRLVGTGFLKQMVRGIAGTVLQIGEGRRPASDMMQIMETQDRTKLGATAPSKGLTLERVWYKFEP